MSCAVTCQVVQEQLRELRSTGQMAFPNPSLIYQGCRSLQDVSVKSCRREV